jgi:CTP:molybdopterin cytidylyltransferase MocA
VAAALGAGARVLLVVGHRAAELAARLGESALPTAGEAGRLVLIDNPRWEEGLLGSIQAALPRVETEAFFVSLADMPDIGSAAYLALAEARAALGPAAARGTALFGSHEGRRGHPVLLPSAWIPGILGLGPGGRLRDYLEGRPGLPVEAGPGALRDIDTPADYEGALSGRLPSAGPDGISL